METGPIAVTRGISYCKGDNKTCSTINHEHGSDLALSLYPTTRKYARLTPTSKLQRVVYRRSAEKEVYYRLSTINETMVELTTDDLRSLEPGRWLNDSIIDSYLALVAARAESNATLESTKYMSSHWYRAWTLRNYAGVQRWTRNSDIFGYDVVLFPVNPGNHWLLVVARTQTRSIEVFDSLPSAASVTVANSVRRYITAEAGARNPKFTDGWRTPVAVLP